MLSCFYIAGALMLSHGAEMLAYDDLDSFRMRSRSEMIALDAAGAEISFTLPSTYIHEDYVYSAGDTLEHCAKTATWVETRPVQATKASCSCDGDDRPTFWKTRKE